MLEFADQEIVEALSYHLRDARVTMRLNEEVESVEEVEGGAVTANLESKKKVTADALLYAVGRAGNVEPLNLPAAGLTADDRGRIKVDADFRTSVQHIFAVGDVIRVWPNGSTPIQTPSSLFQRISIGAQLGCTGPCLRANFQYETKRRRHICAVLDSAAHPTSS